MFIKSLELERKLIETSDLVDTLQDALNYNIANGTPICHLSTIGEVTQQKLKEILNDLDEI
ncbi:MAG: hypothetical protein LKG27_03475 [Clostridiaceae bacterium]|jgi:hypothetical protein|nr:hypothetical protein [Clostridiaceae bacterium]